MLAELAGITGVTEDSRRVEAGFAFVAIRGHRQDGHRYVKDAFRRGAAVAVVEKPVPGFKCVVVPDTRRALSEISRDFWNHPADQVRLIGITGTNGKTTTVHLLQSILQAGGIETGVIGTLGPHFPGVNRLTTPGAPDLNRILRGMIHRGVRTVVLEVSSHGLADKRVQDLSFDAAGFTNLSRDHLDYHGNMADYLACKAGLFHMLQEGMPKGFPLTAVIPYHFRSYFRKRFSFPFLTFGESASAEITAVNLSEKDWGTSFQLVTPWGTGRAEISLPGRHNVWNALTAAALALGQGIPLAALLKGLEALAGVPGRMNRLITWEGVSVVIDYAHNPAGMNETIRALRAETPGRILVVLGGRGQRDRGKLRVIGRMLRKADGVFLTTDSPGFDDPRELALEIASGLGHRIPTRLILDRQAAIRQALAESKSGDTLLVSGRGPEDAFQFQGREAGVSDQAYVLTAIRDLGWRFSWPRHDNPPLRAGFIAVQ